AAHDERLHAWTKLTRRLGAASTPAEAAEVLLSTLADAFPGGTAVVAVASSDRLRADARSRALTPARAAIAPETLDAVAQLAGGGPKTWRVADEPTLGSLRRAHGEAAAIHGVPIRSDSRTLGTLALITRSPSLDSSDWALLESFADLAAQAFQRAWRYAREH